MLDDLPPNALETDLLLVLLAAAGPFLHLPYFLGFAILATAGAAGLDGLRRRAAPRPWALRIVLVVLAVALAAELVVRVQAFGQA